MSEKGPSRHAAKARVPHPAHPSERRVPLPGHQPRAVEGDPDAPRRLAAILASPSYRSADADVDFLHRDETRGVRLQLDYLKAESVLAAHGIRHTIVVFGSTRIPDPVTAKRDVDALGRALEENPKDPERARRLEIAKRVLAKSRYYDVAREFGRLVGSAPAEPDGGGIVVMTGGGPGTMEAANRGAYDAGAKTVGLNIQLPHEQYPNPYVTPELCFRFHYFALRKLHFVKRARALVAFPGGYGTFDELFETLTLVQTRTIEPIPVVLVGEAYWRRAFDVDFLVDEGVIDEEDRELFWYAETAHEIWDGIRHWYKLAGAPLVPDSP
jgi:uncharacterized protein (TIGR00730 family)